VAIAYGVPGTPGTPYAATYDAWNRLVIIKEGENKVAEYEYDGAKRRIIKKTYSGGQLDETRHFCYSDPDRWQVLEERVGQSSDPDCQFVWGLRYIDDLVLRDRDTSQPANGALDERLYALEDALFSVVALTDDTGTIQERYAYHGYGTPEFFGSDFTPTVGGSEFDSVYTFTGRRYDPETGSYHYRNRYYQPRLGRFVGRDPMAYETGDSNAYRYVLNAPQNRADPEGLYIYPIPPSPCPSNASLWLQIGWIYRRLWRGPFPSPHESMPFQHCIWNCIMTLGYSEAFAIDQSAKKEAIDTAICNLGNAISSRCWRYVSASLKGIFAGHCCSADQPSDYSDNAIGRRCGKEQIRDCESVKSFCTSCCTKYGVGPTTPDGPKTARPCGPMFVGRWPAVYKKYHK
jgi:RHS repeat-associated protein